MEARHCGGRSPLYLRSAPILTRCINICWSLFQWCLLFAVAAAVVGGGYLYLRLDDEIRRHVERRLAEHYPNLSVHVGRARFEQNRGIAIFDVTISDRQPDAASPPHLTIDELYLAGEVRMEELVTGELPISEIAVRRAALRAVRRADGSWNINSLLPLPQFGDQSPTIKIEDAKLIVEDATRPTVPQTLKGIDISLTPAQNQAGSNGSSKHFHVEGIATGLPARELRFNGELGTTDGTLNVTVVVGGLEVSSELIAALPGVPVSALSGAELFGRANVTVEIRRSAANEPLTWSAKAAFDRGRLKHAMLPEPLTELTFSTSATAERLVIERLDAKLGQATVALAAERVGWSQKAPLSLAANVVGMRLDERLPAALPESLARLWHRFQPVGDVDAELRITFDGSEWRPHVLATCRGMALTDAKKFHYVIEQATGRVEYRPAQPASPDELSLNLAGVGGGRPVRIEAELKHLITRETRGVTAETGLAGESSIGPAEQQRAGYRGHVAHLKHSQRHPTGWVKITGTDIPLHEELVAAVPKNGQQFVRSLQAQGAIDFHFRAEWKELSQPLADVNLDIGLKNCSLRYAGFPFPLRGVNGLVTSHDWQWKIENVEGRGVNDSTTVKCSGEVAPNENGWRGDLLFEARDIPLDDNFKLALSPACQRAWDELKPHGRIDFNAHVLHQTGQAQPWIEVEMRPREKSVSVELARFPYRFEQLEGVANYKPGRVELQNVRAKHDREAFSAANCLWSATPDGGWQIALKDVNADRLTPHRELIGALPPRLQSAIGQLQPSGTFSLYNGSLNFAKSPNSDRIAAAWNVYLDCHQAALRGSLPLQSVTGGIRLFGRDDAQAAYSAGELELDSVVCKDIQLTNVRGPMWVDSAWCLFGEQATQKMAQPARRITADAYGGSIAGNFDIKHDDVPSYKLDLALGAGDLARFANERLGGPTDMNGTVSGRLVLAGTGQSLQSLNGAGEMHVVDANIYKLPLLVSMLKVLRNRTPDTTAFNRCDMKFSIQGEHIQFQQLNLLGDAVSLYGKGDTDFNRHIDLVFYTLPEPANLPIPLWKTIAGQVSQQTWQLKVVGTWDHAEVQHETLPGVNNMIEQIQSEIQQGAATIAPSTASRVPAASR